jgi:peptide deformylase
MSDSPMQPIVLWSKEVRNYQCQPVAEFDDRAKTLVEQMKKTMNYMDGKGIAAPQIGVFKQAAIAVLERRTLTMFNPQIISGKGDTIDWEACLSLPGCSSRPNYNQIPNRARVHRLAIIETRYQDVNGKVIEEQFSGEFARIIQHEIDHLSGVFFIDRCGPIFRDVVIRNLSNYIEFLEHMPQPV